MKKLLRFALMFLLIFALVMLVEGVILPTLLGEGTELPSLLPTESAAPQELSVSEDGTYTDKDAVALYIHLYGHLPDNYVTKAEAEAAGWTGGPLGKVLPGKTIGGDRFYNREGLLPKAKGRTWTECDVNPPASERGGERIVFSSDGLVYYSSDHYDSFELLYGEP